MKDVQTLCDAAIRFFGLQVIRHVVEEARRLCAFINIIIIII